MKRHALVVGASSGFGAATGAELRRRDWAVSGVSRRESSEASVDRSFRCDVTDEAALAAALAGARDALGPIDALVWCAGTPVMGHTLAVPTAAAREAFETSFWAMQSAARAVLPDMLARRRGVLLVVLSLAALRAVPYEAYYAASKAAASRWLECLAHEVGDRGVAVKMLYPGYVKTGFLERGGWWGMRGVPQVRGSGLDVADVATAACDLLEGTRQREVLGWRERAIVLADRVSPGMYDRLLRRRAAKNGDGEP